MKIIPTVGRIVWFYYADGFGPRAAIVAYVNEDERVNLTVSNRFGDTFSMPCIPLIQDGEVPPEHGNYCTWMPYQIDQAKKHEKESTQ